MIATGFVKAGLGMLEMLGGKPGASWELNSETGIATLIVDPNNLFYHDLQSEEGDYWVSMLRKQSQKALTEGGELVYEGWREVPVCCLATTEDKAFLVETLSSYRSIVLDLLGMREPMSLGERLRAVIRRC
jgi:hypothetical protein